MSEILEHPSKTLASMISSPETSDLQRICDCFMFAKQHSLATWPLKELIEKGRGKKADQKEQLREFVAWCTSATFEVPRADTEVERKVAIEAEAVNPELAKIFEAASEYGRQAAEIDNKAQAHRYWHFFPAWEVHSAYWMQAFPDQDPALVIVEYLKSFFKREHEPSATPVYTLSGYDAEVLRHIAERAAAVIKFDGIEDSWTKDLFILCCGLSDALPTKIENWMSPVFEQLLRAPHNMLTIPALQYWSKNAADDFLDRDNEEVACRQAMLVAGHMFAFLTNDRSSRHYVHAISDRLLLRCLDVIGSASIEFSNEDLEKVWSAVPAALTLACEPVFGGVFPFSFGEAKNWIGESGSWLAPITYYDGEQYDLHSDDYSLFAAIRGSRRSPSSEDRRTSGGAAARYKAYLGAYTTMLEEGLDELAISWWAFFVASQAIGFPGFGVDGMSVKKIAETCSKHVAAPVMIGAVKVALEMERSRLPDLMSRVAISHLQLIEGKASEPHVGRAKVVGGDDYWIEQFLKRQLGEATWLRLSLESRNDLMDAERFWSIAAHSLGAGRRDWGPLIALYGRPVEAEARAHIGPLVRRLAEVGCCEARDELTLGVCMAAIREAKDAIRKGAKGVSQGDVALVQRVHTVFASYKFLASWRNLADHANREKLIDNEMIVRWRAAMYDGRLFQEILIG